MLTGAVRAARAVERAGCGVVTGTEIAAVACFGAAVRGDVGISVIPRRESLQMHPRFAFQYRLCFSLPQL